MPDLQVAATAVGNGLPLNVLRESTVAFQVSGTFVGTVTFEGTVDGVNWASLPVVSMAGGTSTTTATAPGIYIAACAGLLLVRARVSAYTSGAISVSAQAAPGRSGAVSLPANKAAAGDIVALNGAIEIDTNGAGGVGINVLGTWVGTLTFQGSVDGVTWVSVFARIVSTLLPATTTTANGVFEVDSGGFQKVRVTATAYTSGTASIVLVASPTPHQPIVSVVGTGPNTAVLSGGTVAHDGVDSGHPLKIGVKVSAQSATPSFVSTAADRADAYGDFAGRVGFIPPVTWGVSNVPAANTQATISRGSGGAGVRHVCNSISASLYSGSTVVTVPATPVTVRLRDGASGAGTILWEQGISIPTTAGECNIINIAGLNILGTAATAMTLEFSGAGGAGSFETVSMSGYDTV
jgi:hypothetical protein